MPERADPSALMMANSWRRSKVAMSMVLATPKMAMTNTTTMMIQLAEPANWAYSARSGRNDTQSSTSTSATCRLTVVCNSAAAAVAPQGSDIEAATS